jgi:hypothetical protein
MIEGGQMTPRLSLFRRSAPPPAPVRAHRRSGLKRLVVGLALSGAFASTATWIAYRWRKHEQEAFELERRAAPKLLDKLMPLFEFQDSIWVHVDAAPRDIFRAFDEVTPADMPLAWLLGVMRYLPAILKGDVKPSLPNDESFTKQLLAAGNTVLAQEPERELVIGMIGKFRQLSDQAFVSFKDAGEFAAFADPAYQKLAMSIRVEPDKLIGGYTLVLEHRTHALSDEAERQFARYWLAIKPLGGFVTKLLLNATKRRAEAHAAEEGVQAVPPNPTTMSAAA